jgi:hypothetical protein
MSNIKTSLSFANRSSRKLNTSLQAWFTLLLSNVVLCVPSTHPEGMNAGHFSSFAVHARVNMQGSLRKLKIYLHKY